jgi:hypothetical protein
MPHTPILAGMRSNADYWNVQADFDTYTPVLRGTPDDPNLGSDGQAVGSWWRSGHRIRGFARFLFSGTGIDAGTGVYRITIPFPAHPTLNTFDANTGTAAGSGRYRDFTDGTNSKLVGTLLTTLGGDTMVALTRDNLIGAVSATTIPWASGDRISVNFDYIADPDFLPAVAVNQNRWTDLDLLPAMPSRNLDSPRTYSPQFTAAGTDPDVGAGGYVQGWWRLSYGWVDAQVRIRFDPVGPINNGSGIYRISAPLPFDASLINGSGAIDGGMRVGDGSVQDFDTEANNRLCAVQFTASDVVSFSGSDSNSSFNSLIPFTWSNGDMLAARFSYPADPDSVAALLGVA